MLFKGEYTPRQAPRPDVAHRCERWASPRESWIADLYAAALKQATPEERAVALPTWRLAQGRR